MLITHPCASRSQTTYKLNPVLTVAPVVKSPHGFDEPWTGHLNLFPLPNLLGERDYVAKLDEAGPVPREAQAIASPVWPPAA